MRPSPASPMLSGMVAVVVFGVGALAMFPFGLLLGLPSYWEYA